MKEDLYGIDLGTTYSCIAIIEEDDSVKVVSNIQGDQTTPSVVWLSDKGEWRVGKAAKSKLGSDPDNVVAFIKREMSNKDFKRKLQGKEFTPAEISSEILKHLVNFANKKRLNEDGKPPITKAVITVPAYFGELERERTKEAGRKAGLEVIDLVNEPTAAAVSYGRNQGENKNLLVYDLGGGTFDVSIMKFENGKAETLSTKGDHKLGGADWDRAIVNYALEQIGAKWDDLDKATQGMLMNAAEETKKNISDDEEAVLSFNYNGIQNVTIRRSDFEARTLSLMQRTKQYVQEALDAAELTPFDIDEVILVGGSSLMPMVSETVKSLFPDSERCLVDPHCAVAKGAALIARQWDNADQGEQKSAARAPMIVRDKGSRAYGIELQDEKDRNKYYVQNLIAVNDDLEVHKVFDEFVTSENGQTGIELHFYESECAYEFMDVDPSLEIPAKGDKQFVDWGKPMPARTPIQVVVDRDRSGLVKMLVSCAGASEEFVLDTARKGMIKRR